MRAAPAAHLLALAAALAACGGAPAPAPEPAARVCPGAGVAVQILGSGGPEGLVGRAGPGSLVRVDGRPRLLVDAGAGVFARFHTAGARMETLDGVLLTQLGVGHVADLPPLLHSAALAGRSRPLVLVGPGGAPGKPSTAVWLDLAIGPRGAFAELATLRAPGTPFRLAVNEVAVDAGAPRLVYAEAGLEVFALPAPHASGPALGYLVQVGERRIAFTGDQRADDPRFVAMIEGADVLVATLAIGEDAPPDARADHAPPSTLAALARAAKVRRLVLAHLTPAGLAARTDAVQRIRDRFPGPVDVLADLDCAAVAPSADD